MHRYTITLDGGRGQIAFESPFEMNESDALLHLTRNGSVHREEAAARRFVVTAPGCEGEIQVRAEGGEIASDIEMRVESALDVLVEGDQLYLTAPGVGDGHLVRDAGPDPEETYYEVARTLLAR